MGETVVHRKCASRAPVPADRARIRPKPHEAPTVLIDGQDVVRGQPVGTGEPLEDGLRLAGGRGGEGSEEEERESQGERGRPTEAIG